MGMECNRKLNENIESPDRKAPGRRIQIFKYIAIQNTNIFTQTAHRMNSVAKAMVLASRRGDTATELPTAVMVPTKSDVVSYGSKIDSYCN